VKPSAPVSRTCTPPGPGVESINPAGDNMENAIPLQSPERAALIARRRASPHAALWQALDAVTDPEIPTLSLWDLGVLQDVYIDQERTVVVLTPTYSGCPAMATMADDIKACLHATGVREVHVEMRLAPAWSTDWLDPATRGNLRKVGIAPPAPLRERATAHVPCPQCGSQDTVVLSEYGATACKALYRCLACAEPFDHFKPI